MATSLRGGKSAYAGFLNGYIAGNLSANSQDLHFHSDKIFHFLKDLRVEINKWELPADQKKKIDELFDAFSILSGTEIGIEHYVKLGDALYELISYVFICKPELPSTTSFILKKVTYHFLNIAKTSKNTNITKQARRIAEKFDN